MITTQQCRLLAELRWTEGFLPVKSDTFPQCSREIARIYRGNQASDVVWVLGRSQKSRRRNSRPRDPDESKVLFAHARDCTRSQHALHSWTATRNTWRQQLQANTIAPGEFSQQFPNELLIFLLRLLHTQTIVWCLESGYGWRGLSSSVLPASRISLALFSWTATAFISDWWSGEENSGGKKKNGWCL